MSASEPQKAAGYFRVGRVRSVLNGNVNRALMRAYKRSEAADDATLAKTFVSIPPLESMLRLPQQSSIAEEGRARRASPSA